MIYSKYTIYSLIVILIFLIIVVNFIFLNNISSAAAATGITGTWISLNPLGDIPRGRAWFPMTFHLVRGKTVLFGGGTTSGCTGGGATGGYLNDLYTFNYQQNLWVQIHPNNPAADNVVWPYGKDNHVMTYDSYNDVLWVFGGTCGGGLWKYDFKDTDGNPWVRIPVKYPFFRQIVSLGFLEKIIYCLNRPLLIFE